jgi:hypothetical protein
MRDPIKDIVFELVQHPKVDRRIELECSIISRYRDTPGVARLAEAWDRAARVSRYLGAWLDLAGFAWLRPRLIRVLRGKE